MVLAPKIIPAGHSSLTQSVILREEYSVPLAPENSAVQCVAAVDRVLNQIYVDIRYNAVLQCECARCLKSFSLPVAGSCRVVLEEKPSVSPDDDELESEVDFFFDGETEEVDLQSVLYDELMTALPMKPLCRDDCSGAASAVSYSIENDVSAAGTAADVDPRWAALKKFKKA